MTAGANTSPGGPHARKGSSPAAQRMRPAALAFRLDRATSPAAAQTGTLELRSQESGWHDQSG